MFYSHTNPETAHKEMAPWNYSQALASNMLRMWLKYVSLFAKYHEEKKEEKKSPNPVTKGGGEAKMESGRTFNVFFVNPPL